MRLIVCVDERGGLLFNKRRQSRDRVLNMRILELSQGARLLVSPYSAKLFEGADNLVISEEPSKEAGALDFYFMEDKGYSLSDCEEIYLFNWNRHYPSDVKLDLDCKKAGFRLESTREFAGSYHEKITEEHYVKE